MMISKKDFNWNKKKKKKQKRKHSSQIVKNQTKLPKVKATATTTKKWSSIVRETTMNTHTNAQLRAQVAVEGNLFPRNRPVL